MRSVLIKILYIVMIPVIIYDLALIIQTLINSDITPDLFGIRTYSIISGSMSPTIELDDLIITKKVDEDELGINEKMRI